MKLRDVLAALPQLRERLLPDGLNREVLQAYFEVAAGREQLRLRYVDGLDRTIELPPGTAQAVFVAGQERAELVQRAGRVGVCRGCNAEVHWLQHIGAPSGHSARRRAAGTWTPYDANGRNHFINCPAKEQFRRQGA